ncbi:MAG: diaminopimelate epimerase [Bacteroidales bacterium]|nr:diaminopimelate epimerase [Bacteroidales bacterium]
MQIIFNKYHGTGNDFIIIDNRKNNIDPENISLIKHLCDRHMGIGADGLILIYEHEAHDFEMKYFNSDGREGSMCGNGGRCATAFARKTGITKGKNSFMASDGVHKTKISGNIISISLTDTMPPANVDGNHFINTGSPHYVIYVPDSKNVDVFKRGRTIRYSEIFAPGGTNVNFVERRENDIVVRTYERGVENETLSCGTGVTAAAISSKWGNENGLYNVRALTAGGELKVNFNIDKTIINNIYLSGPAEFVFAGVMDIPRTG